MSVKWPEQISRFWFFLGLFLLPLIFWPWATIPYEIPRVWFANRWIEGLGFLGVLGILSGFKPPRRQIDTNLVLLTSFFVIWAIFSSLLGVDFSKSFWGNYYRSDGLLTLFHLAGLSFFLTLFWNHSWWQKTVTALASGATASGVWAIFSGCRQLPTGATFGQPNFLAGFLLICLPFSAFLLIRAKNKNEKIFWALAFTIQIAAILLTFSRAGILGILLFVLGWLFLHKKLPWIVGFLSLGLLLTASLLYLRQNPQQSSPEERLRIITKGIMAFEKRPIFGWGWANFDYAFESVSWPI
jgi:O-antigen ligase